MSTNTITVRVKLWGIVQGVGFRPFVAKLAAELGMQGEVRNIGGLVDIILTDTPERIDTFLQDLQAKKPAPATIVHLRRETLPYRDFDAFTILESGSGDDEAAMIPADLPLCPSCLAEMKDPSNPRYLHPFISCMICGPRYSIIDRIPYDRKNTSMVDFEMCDFCRGEYEDRAERRYHSQTISCHDCGPMLQIRPNPAAHLPQQTDLTDEFRHLPDHVKASYAAILEAAAMIRQGRIIALKGVGGYNYVCSPFHQQAVTDLRGLKIREEKPFAVMFPDVETIRNHCLVSQEEEALLQSQARPIVLLERADSDICEEVCRTSRYIGCFLPSMGAQQMLVELAGPLIVTSANRSDIPIMKDDQEVFSVEDPRLAAVFYNQRQIRIRLDDSVMRVIDGRPQMIRRSKGFAPVPLYIEQEAAASGILTKQDMILATGGQLKSAFCLSKGPFAYVSQYFGDLDSLEACQLYEENVARMAELFRINPGLIVCDLHPLYFTTRFAKGYGNGTRLIQVQHHHAHVASVMAEHHLEGPVLGVSMDGTGYGTDGTIWGGEFLLCQEEGFQRVGHLEPIPMLGGDSSMKEGWKSAMCYLAHELDADPGMDTHTGLDTHPLARDGRYPMIQAALRHQINAIQSSSMGRLFDAIAAFTGIHDTNRYEGECAIMLENAAAEGLKRGLAPTPMAFQRIQSEPLVHSASSIFSAIQDARTRGESKAAIALGFHQAVANMIADVCCAVREKLGVQQIALTGGVFQNKILMEQSLALLRDKGFQVYYNSAVGPNDGGIALGQVYLGMKHLERENRNR